MATISHHTAERNVLIEAPGVRLPGDLFLPDGARGLVIFAHGSGSSRHSPRNRKISKTLNDAGLATLLFDLLTPAEEVEDRRRDHLRFDIEFLSGRVLAALDWAAKFPAVKNLGIGLFGASTGAAAALRAAAERPLEVLAVVSRGGRPDLAAYRLPGVMAATLFIVGEKDHPVLEGNRLASVRVAGERALHVVPGATHLFPEPGALDDVARAAAAWFTRHLHRS